MPKVTLYLSEDLNEYWNRLPQERKSKLADKFRSAVRRASNEVVAAPKKGEK